MEVARWWWPSVGSQSYRICVAVRSHFLDPVTNGQIRDALVHGYRGCGVDIRIIWRSEIEDLEGLFWPSHLCISLYNIEFIMEKKGVPQWISKMVGCILTVVLCGPIPVCVLRDQGSQFPIRPVAQLHRTMTEVVD